MNLMTIGEHIAQHQILGLKTGAGVGYPLVVSSGTGSQAVAGTGSAIDMAPGLITIPAGLMSATGSVRITAMWKFTGSASTRTIAVKFGGTTYFYVVHATGILSAVSQTVISNKTTASQVGYGIGGASGLAGITTTAVTSTVNTASDVAIQITFLGTGPDTASLEHWIVEYLP